jgi:hypothetical protein
MKQPRSHKIWNATHPNDTINSGDGYVIHHKDENHNNDDPDNHQKMTRGDHRRLHQTGNKHWLFGKHHTKETKSKISASKLGTIASKETKDKLSALRKGEGNSFYGKTHTKEAREKIRIAHLGKPLTEEHKAKLRGLPAWNKGKKNPLSEQTKSKMKEAQIRRRIREANAI